MSMWSWIGEAAEGGVGAVGALFDWVGSVFAGIGDRNPPAGRLLGGADRAFGEDGQGRRRRHLGRGGRLPPSLHHAGLGGAPRRPALRSRQGRRRGLRVLCAADRAAVRGRYRGRWRTWSTGCSPSPGPTALIHEAELVYLERVAAIFGIDEAGFRPDRGASRGAGGRRSLPRPRRRPVDDPRPRSATRYRALAGENHPDALLGRGMPPEAAALAHDRMAAINRAFDQISLERS